MALVRSKDYLQLFDNYEHIGNWHICQAHMMLPLEKKAARESVHIDTLRNSQLLSRHRVCPSEFTIQ